MLQHVRGALVREATQSLSPAPVGERSGYADPFQESARRDFEPLAPNPFKL